MSSNNAIRTGSYWRCGRGHGWPTFNTSLSLRNQTGFTESSKHPCTLTFLSKIKRWTRCFSSFLSKKILLIRNVGLALWKSSNYLRNFSVTRPFWCLPKVSSFSLYRKHVRRNTRKYLREIEKAVLRLCLAACKQSGSVHKSLLWKFLLWVLKTSRLWNDSHKRQNTLRAREATDPFRVHTAEGDDSSTF